MFLLFMFSRDCDWSARVFRVRLAAVLLVSPGPALLLLAQALRPPGVDSPIGSLARKVLAGEDELVKT